MKTSLSPIALVALFVGPGLTVWARQDAPTPAVPSPSPAAESVPILASIPTIGSLFAAQDETEEIADKERALKEKLAALEQRAAELETMLADRLAQQEYEAQAIAVDKERLAADLRDLRAARTDSEGERKALETQIQEYLLRVDPATRQRDLDVRDLLAAVPERIAGIQDEKVRAKIEEAVRKAQANLEAQTAQEALAVEAYDRALQQALGARDRIDRVRLVEDAFQQDEKAHAKEKAKQQEVWRVRSEEMRAQADDLRAEIDRGGYTEAHARYKLLTDRIAEHRAQLDRETARAPIEELQNRQGEQRREERARTTRELPSRRAAEKAAQELRRLEQELADRESQLTEETRLRTELESERRRLAQARAELEDVRINVQRDFTRPEPWRYVRLQPPVARPPLTRVRATEATPRAESSRTESSKPAHSDVTIIVERGDVHVHTGGSSPQVITAPSPRIPGGNVYFDARTPLPAPPSPSPDSQGTTQAPDFPRYWYTPLTVEGLAQAEVDYVKAGVLHAYPNVQLELLPEVELEYFNLEELPGMNLALPELEMAYEFAELPIIDLSLPAAEIEALDVFFNAPVPLEFLPGETPPECDAEPEPESDLRFGGGVVYRNGEMELHADRMEFGLAANPLGSAPSQAELLSRILELSEELKAEVGALRNELRDLREVVRDAPQR